MTKIRYANIIISISVFPLLALLGRDYMLYKAVPARNAAAGVPAREARPEPGIMDYAPVVENGVFPTGAKRLVPMTEAAQAGAATEAEGGGPSTVVLLGTYAGERSFAVFREAEGGQERAFKVGEEVFGAGVLKEVMRDRAVVSRGLRDFTIVLADKDAETAGQVLPAAPEGSGQDGQGEQGLRYSRRLGDSEWEIDQEAVLNSLEDFSSVLTDARLTPKMNDGAVEGFLVTEIRPRGVFDAIGLRNGDVLTRINGFEIDSPQKAMQVLSGLRGETEIALDIVRDGRKSSFRYRIR